MVSNTVTLSYYFNLSIQMVVYCVTKVQKVHAQKRLTVASHMVGIRGWAWDSGRHSVALWHDNVGPAWVHGVRFFSHKLSERSAF